jgi:hypothetical protein
LWWEGGCGADPKWPAAVGHLAAMVEEAMTYMGGDRCGLAQEDGEIFLENTRGRKLVSFTSLERE